MATCECGYEITGNGGALASHKRGKAHRDAMERLGARETSEVIDGAQATVVTAPGGETMVHVDSADVTVSGSSRANAIEQAREAMGLASEIDDNGKSVPVDYDRAVARTKRGESEVLVNDVVWSGPGDGTVVPRLGEPRSLRTVYDDSAGEADTGKQQPTKSIFRSSNYRGHCTAGGYMRRAKDARKRAAAATQ